MPMPLPWLTPIARRRITKAFSTALTPWRWRRATTGARWRRGAMPMPHATGDIAHSTDWHVVAGGRLRRCLRAAARSPQGTWPALYGRMELPLAVGTVGGATRAHPVAQVAHEDFGRAQGARVGEVMAAVGLAQNLAALRALATDGIQRRPYGAACAPDGDCRRCERRRRWNASPRNWWRKGSPRGARPGVVGRQRRDIEAMTVVSSMGNNELSQGDRVRSEIC